MKQKMDPTTKKVHKIYKKYSSMTEEKRKEEFKKMEAKAHSDYIRIAKIERYMKIIRNISYGLIVFWVLIVGIMILAEKIGLSFSRSTAIFMVYSMVISIGLIIISRVARIILWFRLDSYKQKATNNMTYHFYDDMKEEFESKK